MIRFLKLSLVLSGVVLGLAACAGSPVGQIESDRKTVDVEIQRGSHARVVSARAYTDDGGIVMWGRVRHLGRPGSNAIRGHIHAEIKTAQDKIVAETDIPLRLLIKPRQTAREARFFAEIPMPDGLSEDLIVYLKYHGRNT